MIVDGEWKHPKRPPIGQYQVTLLWTGDDLGEDHVVWLIEQMLTIEHAAQAGVLKVERVGKDRRDDEHQ